MKQTIHRKEAHGCLLNKNKPISQELDNNIIISGLSMSLLQCGESEKYIEKHWLFLAWLTIVSH